MIFGMRSCEAPAVVMCQENIVGLLVELVLKGFLSLFHGRNLPSLFQNVWHSRKFLCSYTHL
jgi:hypothetical protein